MVTTGKLLKMAKEQNTTVDKLFGKIESPRKLTLEEIESLPKASVIWREEHITDSEEGIEYFTVDPMMIGVPGKNGVLSFANLDSFSILDIDEKLITGTRFFWDSEPDPAVISSGIHEEEYNKFWNNFDLGYNDLITIGNSRIIFEITKRGFTLDFFAQFSGISKARLIMILKDPERITVSEVDAFKQALLLSDDLASELFFTQKR